MDSRKNYFEYLKIFKSSYLHFRLKGAFNGTSLFETHVDKCIETLEKFFGADYFVIKIQKIEERGKRSKPTDCWLIYQMAQSKLNLGSFYLVMEIANIIDFYQKSDEGVKLLNLKLKTKDGRINEPLFADSFLELYTGYIFKKAGIDVELNRIYKIGDVEKPMDVYATFKSTEYLIECKRISTDTYLSTLYDTFGDIISMPHKWSESNKFRERLPEIAACGFLKIPDCLDKEKELNKLKTRLFKELRTFLKRVDEPEENGKFITYSDKEFYVEKYHKATYESYPTLIGEHEVALFFKILPRIDSDRKVEFRMQAEFSIKGLDWNKRVVKAIKGKSRQHNKVNDLGKVILIEIESFHGLSFPINRKHVNVDLILKRINSPKTVLVVLKNSGMGNLTRTPILISNEIGNKIDMIKLLKFISPYNFGLNYSLISS